MKEVHLYFAVGYNIILSGILEICCVVTMNYVPGVPGCHEMDHA